MAIHSFREIVDLWDDRHSMAADIGVPFETVRKWRERDRIPAAWWTAIAVKVPARKARVTVALMASIAAQARRDSLSYG